jgi:Pectate lyase superfamily protein
MQRRSLLALGGAATLFAAATKAQPVPVSGVVNPKEPPFNAVGNYAADDTAALQAAADFCFGPAARPNGTVKATNNRVLLIPPGDYRITSPIKLTKLHGGRIVGAGRFATKITNTAGGSVFATNGCGYSHFEGMYLHSEGKSATAFDLNWDNQPGGPALQSNTFSDIFFHGGSNGIEIGAGGFMGSENIFINCFWYGCQEAGIKTSNFNACQNTIVGGNFQLCNIGAWVQRGSITLIDSTGFQLSRQWDIRVDNSADDTINVIGCRTESSNFVKLYNGVHGFIAGCTQSEAGQPGHFLEPDGCPVTVERCVSVASQISLGSNARLTVRGSSFGRADWLQHFPLNYGQAIEIEDVQYGGTPNRSTAATRRIARQRIVPSGVYNYVTAPA